ncbi:hypothetical protein BDR05DRAFT_1005778 [Suillus weaverae]|nr:hypothetical protein BDR05DRAFT_1005778 [Suillus weaverae]
MTYEKHYDASFTTESHPSDHDCSLVPSRAEIDALECFDGWTEAEWIDEMCEEEAQDDSGDDEMDIEVNVSKLLVTNDGRTCTTDLEFLLHDLDSHWATLNISGTALHNDAILAGLSGLTLDADSFDSGHSVSSTPPSSPVFRPLIFTLEAPPPAQPVMTTCVVPSSLTNQCVTAMQNILTIEDSLIQALRHAMHIHDNNDNNNFDHHISPSIQEQLSGNYDPSPIFISSSVDKENNKPASPAAQPSLTK